MSSIKVAVRCRPWTKDDKLGVHMIQNGEEEGEINLLNSDYSTKRFAFSYSWWTAFNWKHHAKSDLNICEDMPITNQTDVFKALGPKIKAELYDGNAIVLFAYGLSGSGKTFTVFGMDAVDNPVSWFHQPTPHDMWGLFPALAYELFQDKQDGWKITMKYFQNVVDIVRDLMSPTGEERMYKEGMRKDQDGFMDIEWCSSAQLNSWDDLRKTFLTANARKAIAPTQFNHQSTRGHCIMVLDVTMPDAEDPTMKKRGRIYVCDLAGTEPAGDIVYATYKKVIMPDGTEEQKYTGPHKDQKKTKELQEQGKKINLSLSEMAQFFMKMAEAFKKKKLKPGMTIPGCNSYFLCKFLKDTLLQSKTYLFCAIRPEVEYLKYTFATLGFAKNASVVQLAPKKATTACTPAERKLLAQLEQMKQELEAAKKAAAEGGGGGGGGGEGPAAAPSEADTEAMAEMQKQLEEARNALANADNSGPKDNSQQEELEKQREQYAKRGISLMEFESNTTKPHFVNLDEDPFRSKRFLYILKEAETTTFGPKCDCSPPSFSLKRDHCSVEPFDDGSFILIGGAGDTFLNGKYVGNGERVALAPYDWVAMGTEMMLFSTPGKNPDAEPDMDSVFEAFQEAVETRATAGGGGEGGGGEDAAMAKRIEELEKANASLQQTNSTEAEDVDTMDVAAIVPVYKRCKEVAQLCKELDRDMLRFDPALAKNPDTKKINVTIKVKNTQNNEEISLTEDQFRAAASVLSDEKFKLDMALQNDDFYETPEQHDPINVMYDNNCFHLGSATMFPEYLVYCLDTDEGDFNCEAKRSVSPYDVVGTVEHMWVLLSGENAEEGEGEIPEINDPSELIGKPWTGKLTIKRAFDLPVMVDQAYVTYEFFGSNGREQFTTNQMEEGITHAPVLDYSFVHHVPVVTQEFVDFLESPIPLQLYVSPAVDSKALRKARPVSTSNQTIRRALMGDDAGAGSDPFVRASELEKENAFLKSELSNKDKEILALKAEIYKLKNEVASGEGCAGEGEGGAAEGGSSVKSKLAAAQEMDAALS